MRFSKWHGAGNDYLFVDVVDFYLEDAPRLARAMSDRRRGAGADGLILLAPSERADVRMIMYNADGSRAEMCGNGLRCLAHFAHRCGRTDRNPLRVETDAGIRTVELYDGGARIDMGPPELAPERIPVRLPGPRVVDHPIDVDDRGLRMTCVSMGNPHAVIFVDDVRAVHLDEVGPLLERHPAFPERVNVSFVEVEDPSTALQRTWERGSGETEACGTGACAVCVAGWLTGRTGSPLACHLPGGILTVEWDGEGSVFLSGPAEEIYRDAEWRAHGM